MAVCWEVDQSLETRAGWLAQRLLESYTTGAIDLNQCVNELRRERDITSYEEFSNRYSDWIEVAVHRTMEQYREQFPLKMQELQNFMAHW